MMTMGELGDSIVTRLCDMVVCAAELTMAIF